MAKILTELVTITVSKLVKDGAQGDLISDDFIAGIEAMAQEMLEDNSLVVEVERGLND